MQKLWAELPLSVAASSFPSSGRSLGSGEHQLDVWGAGRCPANSCSTKNGTFQTSFCSCFYTVRDVSYHLYWYQRMAASLTQGFYCHRWIWVLARDCCNNRGEFQLSVGQKKMTFLWLETAAAGPGVWHHSMYSQRVEQYRNYLSKLGNKCCSCLNLE